MKPWYEAKDYSKDNMAQSHYENGHYDGQIDLLEYLSDGAGRLLEEGMEAVSKGQLNSMLEKLTPLEANHAT